jgi:predicted nicotinamide N-methyase
VLALDLDPQSRRAAELNAALNGLEIETIQEAPMEWDLMLAADVLYETGLRDWVLGTAVHRGPILLADPERTGTPRLEQREFARVDARTFPDVDSPQKEVALYWLGR